MKPIDLRSDTVTRPSPAMREAMARADVGDDVYGEDPTVNLLQEKVAALLGKEAGLFVASGTMANQLALGALTRPGDEVICAEGSHCQAFEGGALAALWGVQPRPVATERGLLEPGQVEAAMRPRANDHYPWSRVLELENTHNRGGGAVYPPERLTALYAAAKRLDLFVYLDGARLMNASVASRTPAKELAAGATLVSICLSKGLGAPVGSVLCGTREHVAAAHRLRKRVGGGMRQAGILAAAGLYALEHNVERLAEDHANAKRLAELVGHLPGASVVAPETNLLFVRFPGRSAVELTAKLKDAGVLCNPEGSQPDVLRFVTHLDVSAAEIEEAGRRMAKLRL